MKTTLKVMSIFSLNQDRGSAMERCGKGWAVYDFD